MPLGWERINAKHSQPNKNIVFIKPRPGPDEPLSRDFLERIAAQCLPIMNRNHLSVVSLEEYEPNLEFWGRNFNNGEVIQLVLRSPATSRWLPFEFVQMVMMHELAHCKEMNHSTAFWKIRNAFADEMRALWKEHFTGEGLWGRGTNLADGMLSAKEVLPGEAVPEHICGGTFRSRTTKKRKTKARLSWKEAQERRVRKKFGVDGIALGSSENINVKLENGKTTGRKPRVAGSVRGRELRAAAALARFDAIKAEKEDPTRDGDSEMKSDVDDLDYIDIKVEPDDAIDINGERLFDRQGNMMIKICDEDDRNGDAEQQEWQELKRAQKRSTSTVTPGAIQALVLPSMTTDTLTPQSSTPIDQAGSCNLTERKTFSEEQDQIMKTLRPERLAEQSSPAYIPTITDESRGTCPVCSAENHLTALTCLVCSHVLKVDFVTDPWKCRNYVCTDTKYINAGDAGLCGICGRKRS